MKIFYPLKFHLTRLLFIAKTFLIAITLYVFAMPASLADPGGGNNYFDYTINGAIPIQGLTEISFYLTVQEEPHRSSDVVYWSNQFSYMNGSVGYTGMQPRPSANGEPQGMALFSLFGNGAASSDPNCSSGADSGAGISCHIPFGYIVGKTYRFQVTTLGANVWQGSIIDTTTGESTHIGSWTVPSSWRNLQNSQVAFTEFYGNYPSCESLPSTSVLFGSPTAANGTLKGAYTDTYIQGKCRAQFKDSVDAAGGHSVTNYAPLTELNQLVGTVSDMCVTGNTNSSAAGQAAITLQLCKTNAADQAWTANPDGTVQSLGKCLNASQTKNQNGNYIADLQPCDGNPKTLWTWRKLPASSAEQLVNNVSQRCLDAERGASGAGTSLVTYQCGSQSNQLWEHGGQETTIGEGTKAASAAGLSMAAHSSN